MSLVLVDKNKQPNKKHASPPQNNILLIMKAKQTVPKTLSNPPNQI